LTFGGAYAVLAWMVQDVVNTREWMTGPEMLDALGLAETTPGPLILVTQFVGFVAGHRNGGFLYPDLATWRPWSVLLSLIAAFLVFRLHWSLLRLLPVMACAGLVVGAIV